METPPHSTPLWGGAPVLLHPGPGWSKEKTRSDFSPPHSTPYTKNSTPDRGGTADFARNTQKYIKNSTPVRGGACSFPKNVLHRTPPHPSPNRSKLHPGPGWSFGVENSTPPTFGMGLTPPHFWPAPPRTGVDPRPLKYGGNHQNVFTCLPES